MKTLFAILTLVILAFTVPVFAQVPANVQVDITKLTPDQLKVYQELVAMQNKSAAQTTIDNLTPEKVDKYAQMGKGLGIAVSEGLKAITTNVEQFSQTSAGKWLMVLITWKVMGNDAVDLTRTVIQWLVGGFLLVVGLPFWFWLIKRNCVNRPITVMEKTGFWTKKVVYDNDRSPIHDDYIAGYLIAFGVYLGIVAAITFVH